MKKLLSCFLVLLALLMLPGLAVEAGAATIVDSGTCGENLTWTLDSDGLLTISGTGEMYHYNPINGPFMIVDFIDSVRTISVNSGVTSIGDCAFSCMPNLRSVTLGKDVATIGIIPFFLSTRLQAIYVNEANPYFSNDTTGVLFNREKTILIQCPEGISGSYSIPVGVTSVGYQAFSSTTLTNLNVPKSVTSIGVAAFNGCEGLTDVYYGGTKAQWDAINIGEFNDELLNANIHYTESATDGSSFVDVMQDAYYFEPVQWAVKNGITNGMDATHFAPDGTCTRGQIVTFLWRAKGSPEPQMAFNPFSDVSSSDYFYKAVLWAVEKGITTGTSATTFSPDAGCTRGQVATFLWRSQKQPASGGNNIFTDIVSGTYYYNAVLWAVENGITNGMGDGTFAPDATCTRGQIVTFLYRAMA